MTGDDRLLIIDDEAGVRSLVIDVAEMAGFEATGADEPEAFRKAYESFQPTVIVVDLQMPHADGIEILRYLSGKRSQAQILLISGVDPKILSTAERLGSAEGLSMLGALKKPFNVGQMKGLLAKARQGLPKFDRSELQRALTARELVVYYQPKATLCPGQPWVIEGAEALVRWQHPQHGLVMPDAFIPGMERENLIGDLTIAVLETALDQLSTWSVAQPLSLSINLAAQLLEDLDLPDRLAEMAASRGVAPTQIILEITETGVMRDAARAMDVLTRFRLKGFGLSMDDFGTGYSSLVQIYRLPFNELKIDKSFVMDADTSEEARTIIRSAIALAHGLGLSVCAEGVETPCSMEFLYELRCDKAQGYLIGRPSPPQQFEQLAAKSSA